MAKYGETFVRSIIEKDNRDAITEALAESLPGEGSNHSETGDWFWELNTAEFIEYDTPAEVPKTGRIPIAISLPLDDGRFDVHTDPHLAAVEYEASFEVVDRDYASNVGRTHEEELAEVSIEVVIDDEYLLADAIDGSSLGGDLPTPPYTRDDWLRCPGCGNEDVAIGRSGSVTCDECGATTEFFARDS